MTPAAAVVPGKILKLMTMARPSLFEGLLPRERESLPVLLDLLYSRLGGDIDRLEVQIKGKLSDHEGRLKNLQGRLDQLENCPCQVHRDPGHSCPIGEIRDQLNIIQRRMAWFAGIFAAASAVLYVLPTLWWMLAKH